MDAFIDLLPRCPFLYLQEIPIDSELLAFVSWVIPFPQIIALLQAWTVAIGVWYVVKVGLRWAKAIR